MPILAPIHRGARSSHLFLRIHRTFYEVQALPCDPIVAEKAFRLNKSDGTLYDVAKTPYGLQCDCPDFIFRREGIDPTGCKHVKALVAEGLIDGGPVPRPV
jgi:hypothetical protein